MQNDSLENMYTYDKEYSHINSACKGFYYRGLYGKV